MQGATQQKNVKCVYQAEDSISQILQYSFLLIELGRGRKLVWFYPSRDWPLLRYPLRLGCEEMPCRLKEGVGQSLKEPTQLPSPTNLLHTRVAPSRKFPPSLPNQPNKLVPHPAVARTCLFPPSHLHSSLNSST